MTTPVRATVLAALALLLGQATPARAITIITVTSTQDELTVNGNCTLREAIHSANTGQQFDLCGPGAHADSLPADEKLISVPAGDYFLALTGAAEDNNASGDLDINASMTIQGAGAASTRVSANTIDRVFDIGPTASPTISVSLAGLTIDDGQPPLGGDGGGIRAVRVNLILSGCTVANNRARSVSTPPTTDTANGAGIFFSGGTLTITNSLIANNRTTFGSGGGIYHDGAGNGASVVNISASTISGNRAEITSGTSSAGGIANIGGTLNIIGSSIRDNFADGQAGGILNFFSFAVTNIANTTISGNRTYGSGGGIRNSGQMYLTHVTVADNTADADSDFGGLGGGIRNQGALQMKASIVFGNQDLLSLTNNPETEQYPDIYDNGALSSAGYNLFGDIRGTTAISAGVSGELVGVDPRLLAVTGDPAYYPLDLASPALHHIPAAACTFVSGGGNPLFADGAAVTSDQAGNPRPDATTGRCDIGAHEPHYFQVALPLIQQP